MLIRRGSVGLLLVVALWRFSVLAFAQAQPLDPVALLADLDSPDYAVRSTATQTLLAAPHIDDDEWGELFAQARSPEQRHRLLAAARHHLLATLRRKEFPERGPGSLGMTQRVITPAERLQTGRAGVLVNSTLPGFPAYAHLLPGDLIVAINGTPIDTDVSDDRFQQLVQLNPAGQTVTLTLVRDGQDLDRQITLASFEALARMYERGDMGVSARFEVQWRQWRDRLVVHASDAGPVQIELLQ